MNEGRLLSAALHADKAMYHKEELRQLVHALPRQPEATEGLTYSQRFERVYLSLLPYLTEVHRTNHFVTPEVPICGLAYGEPSQAWVQFSVNGDGDGTGISYSVRSKGAKVDRLPGRSFSGPHITRATALHWDIDEREEWHPLSDIEETLEVYLQAVEKLSPTELAEFDLTVLERE